MALAMGHVILRDDLQDSDFISTWTNVTVDELKAHYKQYTPEWAAKISGVPAATIERIAREFATTKPATLFTYRGPAKHLYGSYNEKACMMLPIMTGNVETPRRLLPAARHGLAAAHARAAQAGQATRYLAHPPPDYPLGGAQGEPPDARSGSPRGGRRSTSISPTRTTRSIPIPAPRRCGASSSATRS
ncbi:MAG: molybdopterin-dependent oxidoreductase [Comamonadaceae bacterium]|nr:molybdopterin-dependent oxidoreductase [Comamonadaceae bacterium]